MSLSSSRPRGWLAVAAAAVLALAAGGGARAQLHASGWNVVPAPSRFATLNSLASLSESDIWAAGYRYDTQRGVYAPATEHWNGQQWRFFTAPHETPGYNAFNGIGGSAAGDVWAVGYGTPRYDQYTQAPLIEHWDGTGWQVAPGASVGKGVLNGVAALASDDAWAVGTSHGSSYGALIEHWNGSNWSVVANPDQAAGELYAVAARSADDVWAVGAAPADTELRTLVLHWDGVSWTRVPSANGPLSYNLLTALAFVPGSNAIWGVGWQSTGYGYESLAIQFDGATSTYTPTPSGGDFLYGVAGVSSNRAWAVGYGDGQTPRFLRWDGGQWTRVNVAAAGQNGILTAIVRAGSTLWAVGYSNAERGGALFLRNP
jgi:hypothetical protein